MRTAEPDYNTPDVEDEADRGSATVIAGLSGVSGFLVGFVVAAVVLAC